MLRCLEERIDDFTGLVEPASFNHFLLRHMALQRCHNAAGMHRECSYAVLLPAPVKLDGEQTDGRLGLAVSQEFMIRLRLCKMNVVPANR
ncbi:hypothetical protein D3C76_1436000 [compost metagenome]